MSAFKDFSEGMETQQMVFKQQKQHSNRNVRHNAVCCDRRPRHHSRHRNTWHVDIARDLVLELNMYHSGSLSRAAHHNITIVYHYIQPHSSVNIVSNFYTYSQGSSTQCPILPSWPNIRSFTWWGLETSSW